jgi:tRNA-2-methylthio-N6-dimethylallyladenosine synthase
MSGAAVNQRHAGGALHADLHGHLLDVWVLTPSEMARKPWPTTPQEAAAWSFNPDTQKSGAGHEEEVFIRTFGCQMNEYDSDKMADVLRAAEGYEPTTDVEEADLILFNTCSVREKAQEKVFSDLGRVKHLKKKGVLIGVGGCVASQEGAAIIERAPYVDIVFGPQTLHRLPQMIAARSPQQRRPQVDISFPEIEKFDHLPPARVEGASAFVSIMEGCSKYCVLRRALHARRRSQPPLRRRAGRSGRPGRARREGSDAAGAERQRLPRRDGQHGRDRRLRPADRGTWPRSPASSASATPPATPTSSRNRLIEVYGRVPQLVNHLHLPVQHGSDRILAAMKRGYTAMEYKSTIRKLRAVRPGISLSSDFIVGFPGETEDDFARP